MGYIVAFLLGIFVATVGVTGVARMADSGVTKIQDVMRDTAR